MQLRIRKKICILLSALMLMSALFGCAGEEASGDERFVLRAAVCSRLDSLDPAMNVDPRAESIFYALYENLMRVEDDGTGHVRVVPGIAKSYQETENADGTVDYVFTLRSSARWSDGKRVRARDFAYAWRRLVDPATGSPNHAALSMVRGYEIARTTGDLTQFGVKAEGDTTLRVTLAAPCAFFIGEACTAVATMPLRSDAVENDPEWTSTISAKSNGAYQVSVWSEDEYIQLRRSDSYYGARKTGPDTLRFIFTSGEEESLRMYADGRADYALVPPGDAAGESFVPLRATVCVLYNHMSDLFSNKHIRRAFDLSLDRASIAAALGEGVAPAEGLVPPGMTDAAAEDDFRAAGGALCAADAGGYGARCLLAVQELHDGGYWSGESIPTVSCMYVAEDETRTTAAAVAASWSEGLGVSVATLGVSREEFDRRVSEGDYELAIDTLASRRGDAMEFLAPFAGVGADNALHFASTSYDLLIGVAETSDDPAARAAFLHDAEVLLLRDTALSPLYYGTLACALRDGLDGVWHDLRGNPCFNGVTRS